MTETPLTAHFLPFEPFRFGFLNSAYFSFKEKSDPSPTRFIPFLKNTLAKKEE
jgi:hypothetical protein